MAATFVVSGLLLPAPATARTVASGTAPARFIELYTSEGCSSCPPADEFLSELHATEQLFRETVPIAFHVDYWDALGWPDRLANAQHSARQRAHARAGRLGSVYTPGFLVNGKEWRGWFAGQRLPAARAGAGGSLTLEVSGEQLSARYLGATDEPVRIVLAVLGMGLSTEVPRGENRGRTLNHDFAVLATAGGVAEQCAASRPGEPAPKNCQSVTTASPLTPAVDAPRYALVAFVEDGNGRYRQAVGTELNAEEARRWLTGAAR